ncbi:MAG: ubiquinone biosynthesis protein [Alphaproteobacteria bacterium]|nr:ubiquinone biosynthesis protein [Alphaproteobacteria bacterium]
MTPATAPSTLTYRRDWRTAFRAVRALLSDPNDTVQVFRIMGALNGAASRTGYQRLIKTPEGGVLAYRREELVAKLMDRIWLAQYAPGTVGAAYRDFLDRTGYSAGGLADVSKQDTKAPDVAHPYAWFGRRTRDMHDIWHVLTGYQADEPLGEVCLVAFSYAQTGGLGWAFIALSAVLKDLRKTGGRAIARAAWEGYRHGRKASWLAAEDIDTLFAEPIEAARRRLNIAEPVRYAAAQQRLRQSREATFAMGTPA